MSTEQLESVPSRSDPAYIDGKTTGTIADFLADNRPSNANPEHAWIWVRGRKGEDDDERIPTSDYGKMVENAMAVAAKLAEDCEAIKKDDRCILTLALPMHIDERDTAFLFERRRRTLEARRSPVKSYMAKRTQTSKISLKSTTI